LFLCLGLGAAQTAEPTEYAIKGAYLFKFGEYVSWPPSRFASVGDPFVIGILGTDPFGASLDQEVQGRTVQGHPILVKRFARPDQLEQVHVLYVAGDAWAHPEQVREVLQGRNILTVSEKGRGSEAIVSFILQQGRVRFEIDAGAADREGLKLSSKLLSLAVAVKRPGGG
jgi:hypothetical protein